MYHHRHLPTSRLLPPLLLATPGDGWEGLAAPCMGRIGGRMHHRVHASFDHGKPMCAKCFKSTRDRSLITVSGGGGGGGGSN